MPRPHVRPVTAGALPVGDVIAATGALARLAERLRASDACLAAVRASVPAPLRDQLKAGPYDEAGWSILAPNAAVAAKLRHLVPRLERELAEAGLHVASVRVRVAA